MTNTSAGQVSSLTVVCCVILCSNQCEQRIQSAGFVPNPPSFFVLARHSVPRQWGDTYGSPVEVCVRWLHNLTHTHKKSPHFFYHRQILQESLAKLGERISRRQSAGQNITQSVDPRGVQLDPKYLNEYSGSNYFRLFRMAENHPKPRAYRGFACLEKTGPEISRIFLCCGSAASDTGSCLCASEAAATGVLGIYL